MKIVLNVLLKVVDVVKIKNRTTKIKLELLPEEETELDKVDEKDLYLHKNLKKYQNKLYLQKLHNYNNH